MIAVIQRVKKGVVRMRGEKYSQTGPGYVVLAGICQKDTVEDVKRTAKKICDLRIIADNKGKMNLSIKEVKGEILVVSQFTLCADLTKGRRPSFIRAEKPVEAERLYNIFVDELKNHEVVVETGKFGEYMDVELTNDGPVTIVLDSTKI